MRMSATATTTIISISLLSTHADAVADHHAAAVPSLRQGASDCVRVQHPRGLPTGTHVRATELPSTSLALFVVHASCALPWDADDDDDTASSFQILSKLLPEGDMRLADANIWLKQHTAKAVQAEIDVHKKAKEVTIPSPEPDEAQAASDNTISAMPIPDLVKYILSSAPSRRSNRPLVSQAQQQAKPRAAASTTTSTTTIKPTGLPGKGLASVVARGRNKRL